MARNTRAKKVQEAPQVDIGAEIFESLRELEKLKGIPVEYMVERLKQALTNAYRKDREDRRDVPADNVVVDLTENGLSVHVVKTAVEELEDTALEMHIDAAKNINPDAKVGETVTIPMMYQTPEILSDAVPFQDVLGSCETKHTDDENRNTNLRLVCEILDGYTLQPGEEFSYNTVVGERTAERGYKPAPAYSGYRLVDSIGGGVCQGSTTLYNCVLLADLEVVFRACHGAKVRYVPLGLDCAINYLTTDFQFRNNFHCPIRIKAWMEDGYMKMQILGTDEKDYYIKMETGTGEDDFAYYARSYKCKYSKATDELLSRDVEAFSTYYKSVE